MTIKAKVVVFFTICLSIFAFFALYINFLATPLIINTSRFQLEVYLSRAVNFAITNAMNQAFSYDDLVEISSDESGDIQVIKANPVKVNSISMAIEKLTLNKIQELSKTPISIPLGAFSGVSIFSGIGPPVNIDIYPYGEVGCKFLSQFISAGINQTQHKIYVCVDAAINVVLPFKTISVDLQDEVLVCESIIIGKIPKVYFKSSLSDMLSLAED